MPAKKFKTVVIGASAGAVEALNIILPELPKNRPLAIVIVVHIPPDKKSVMSELFKARCKMHVKEAEDKEPLQKGTIYFAPPNYHLMIEKNRILSLSSDEPVLYSRPSIDVLFETAADSLGKDIIGIILTGANSDGAEGLKNVIENGGVGLIQCPNTAYASTMPRSTLDACPNASALSLEQIAFYLKKA